MLKKLIIVSTSVIFIIALYLIFKNEILNIFKKGQSLNYNEEISSIEVLGNFETDGNSKYVMFYDIENINKIINYINSLEIIEEERPDYSYLDDEKLISISIFDNEGTLSGIVFTKQYMIVHYNGYDWDCTEYYVKDSDYNFITKETKIYKYFRDLINQQ